MAGAPDEPNGGARQGPTDRLEAGRLLFAGPIAFERGAPTMAQLPDADRAEIAFAGRSNVGKSSLINAVAGRKALARASSEPGRTRELNFFLIGDHLRLVDMPGYGYAKAPKTEIERWTGLVRDYLRGRTSLQRVFLLIDSRHGVKPNDAQVMDLLDESAVVYQLVLTKHDKLKKGELDKVVDHSAAAVRKRPAAHPLILAACAETLEGVPELRAEIFDLIQT